VPNDDDDDDNDDDDDDPFSLYVAASGRELNTDANE